MSWWKIPTPKRYAPPDVNDCSSRVGAADYERMSAVADLHRSLSRFNIRVHATVDAIISDAHDAADRENQERGSHS